MKLIDLNILLYAINRFAPQHNSIRAWWERALSSDEPVGLPWIVLLGFLRVATNRRVFEAPLSVPDAIGRVETWLAQPNVRIVPETEQHWPLLRSLLEHTGTAGNLTTDVHLAALAISCGATLISCDTDFARFPHLRWENPANN